MRRVELSATIFLSMLICLFWAEVIMQECLAGGGDEAEIRGVIEDFHTAWNNKDIEMMDEIWSHADDVRWILYDANMNGQNIEIHSWIHVRQNLPTIWTKSTALWNGSKKAGDMTMEMREGDAAVTFDSSIGEDYSDKSYAHLRREDGVWRIYLMDFTGLVADRTGNVNGDFAAAAFQAEDGSGAQTFVRESQDASGGSYIVDIGPVSFDFDAPVDGEYVVWGRTHAPSGGQNSFSVAVDDVTGDWDVGISSGWVWNQINQKWNMGPRIMELSKGKHTLTLSKRESGTMLDALYVTNNLSLRADQIQERFDVAIGYIEEPEASMSVRPKGKMVTTWARIKDNGTVR